MDPIDYYRATAPAAAMHAALAGRVECDTCVVGGGFAGLNTALGLAERGHRDVVLLEATRVGRGASGRNGGFVFGGFSRGEDRLLEDLGAARARALYAGTTDAVELIRARIDRYGIACERTDAGVLWANWFQDPSVLRKRQRLLANAFGVEWDWVPRAALRGQLHTTRYSDALFEPRAFHFHPLKYVHGIARAAVGLGVRLHEGSPATGLCRDGAGWRIDTPAGTVHARRVVLACGGYLAGLRGSVDAGVLPIATYAMATEPLGERLHGAMSTRAAVYDTRFAFDYYRPMADTRLLWGGRISIVDRDPGEVARLLRGDLLKVFPQLEGVRIDHAWSGLMSYARHEMPQVGLVDQDLWLAQAFGGHGVAPTAFAGELLASAIAEGDTRWRELGDYGLVSALKPAGFVGAQLRYWWLQGRDAWKDWRERVSVAARHA
ncbi:MAG TPA: FAD-binding oxidoreductase [Xanthomonadaceae bacterium]|nr:FAD-binding oxidoreductase [Xanthomonadaceae bacterium]